MAGQRIGYIRVSSLDQQVDRQLDGMELDQAFTDKASGKDAKRPQLEQLLRFARKRCLSKELSGAYQVASLILRSFVSRSGLRQTSPTGAQFRI
jgi:predicted site-specific integrase-resolvase